MEKVKPVIPKGMRDFLPQRMIVRNYVIRVITEVFESFGFEPMMTPAIEYARILEGKYGTGGERLLYKFKDRGGRELALRFDLTIPLCRVIAMYPELVKPFKRYQIAPGWRSDKPQPRKGRYREFWWCDVDIVGSSAILADAEVLNVIYEVLMKLGFKKFTMRINNWKLLTGMAQYAGVSDDQLGITYRSIGKFKQVGLAEVRNELEANSIAETVIGRLFELLVIKGESRAILSTLKDKLATSPIAMEGIIDLEEIVGYLEVLGIEADYYQVDLSTIRGMDYYSGLIFEVAAEEPQVDDVAHGGRFDELAGTFMGGSYPATGATISVERIFEVVEGSNLLPTDVRETVTQVLVTIFTKSTVAESLKVAKELRDSGLNTDVYLEITPLDHQIRYALKKGIPFMVIIGPDEVATGKVTIKNLALKEQETVDRHRMANFIKGWMIS